MTDDLRTRIAKIIGHIHYRFFPGRWTQAEIDDQRRRAKLRAAHWDAVMTFSDCPEDPDF